MFRLCCLLLLLSCACQCHGEVVVFDNFGNLVGLPTTGGNATGGFTVANTAVQTSPYILTIYITDILEPNGNANTVESFYMLPLFGPNGTLVAQLYTPATFNSLGSPVTTGTPTNGTTLGSLLGTQTNPNFNIGIYTYTFTLPHLGAMSANLTYNSTNPALIDRIYLSITNNPIGGFAGDPQFAGLRGQSYQIHGIDGAVYNIITEKDCQINSRFVFLSEGRCPIINGVADTNCWSHPGSYVGELSFQQIVDGKVHTALVTAGSAKKGFASVQVDGGARKIGETVVHGVFSVNYTSSHKVSVSTNHFDFQVHNSDMFVNEALFTKVPLSTLTSHGLLGQTHANKVYPGTTRYIEGSVDDYVIGNDDIFGTDFVYNQFQP